MSLAETFALQRALQDTDFRNGLEHFFNHEAAEATLRCREEMATDVPNVSRATKLACTALAYEEAMTYLKNYIEEQLAKGR